MKSRRTFTDLQKTNDLVSCQIRQEPTVDSVDHGTLGHRILEHHLGHQRLHRSFPLNFLLISNSIINLFSNSEYSLPRIKNTWSNKASLIHSLKRNSSPLKTDRDPNENVILQPLIFTGCWFQEEYYPNNPYMAYVPIFTIKTNHSM